MELDAIAAVVIGGTNLMGGRGRIAGTLVGVLIFGLLSNILQLRNIDSNIQLVLKGAIIVVAVLLQEGRFRRR
jgi:simple sugar transport system permease protein